MKLDHFPLSPIPPNDIYRSARPVLYLKWENENGIIHVTAWEYYGSKGSTSGFDQVRHLAIIRFNDDGSRETYESYGKQSPRAFIRSGKNVTKNLREFSGFINNKEVTAYWVADHIELP